MTPLNRPRTRLPQLAVAAVALAVLVVLLAPRHMDGPIGWLGSPALLGRAAAGGSPLWWALEDVANVALFVPLGYVLVRWTGRPGLAVMLGITISALCEFAQQWIPQRHASLLDVSMNSLGAAAGVALCLLLHRMRPVRRVGVVRI